MTPMATLHVRGLPEDLYDRLRERAARSRRSIAAEAIETLDGALTTETGPRLPELLATAEAIRARSPAAEPVVTAADLIREDRER